MFFRLLFPLACFGWASHSLAQAPDLSHTVPILEEHFENGLNRYDGMSGLWSTLPRRGQLMTNAAQTVFLDRGVLDGISDDALPSLHDVTDEGLALRSAALSPEILEAVRSYMRNSGQGGRSDKILYATGEITTAHTWAQTYGYFEIVARFPRGKGRWPAFWLTHAGLGWPPEIDVVEAYGAGLEETTPKDDSFNTAVFFDRLDANLQPNHEVDITNPYAVTPEEVQPKAKERGRNTVYNFHHRVQAQRDFGSNIYDDFHTYAMMWTPEHVIFYFGPDRRSLKEVYRTPTPEDVNDPMFIIANDQFTARGGGWAPREEVLDQVLDPENAFYIKSITVRAIEPRLTVDLALAGNAFDPRDSLIRDTDGDDVIAPGDGFDLIELSGGADHIKLTRSRFNKVISGFGPDDVVTLEGYPFASAQDVMERLTQVGADVWLPTGADPGSPHTVVFRDARVSDFTTAQFDIKWPVPLNLWRASALKSDRPSFVVDESGAMTSDAPGAWYSDKGQRVRMIGTTHGDRYVVAHGRTEVVEVENGGVDELFARTDYRLPSTVERGVAQKQGIRLSAASDGSRIETETDHVTLLGGKGEDLFVIQPDVVGVTVWLGDSPGHDHLRGFGVGHRLNVPLPFWNDRERWVYRTVADGTVIEFSPSDSLLVEGVSEADLKALIERD